MIKFLDKKTTLAFHRDLVETYGGSEGVRDEGLLESALAQPKASFSGHRTIITRKGKTIAVMVPLDDLEAIEALEDQKDVEEAKRILSDPESEFIPWEQAKKE